VPDGVVQYIGKHHLYPQDTAGGSTASGRGPDHESSTASTDSTESTA
jgi:hypothetical protein